MADTQTNQQGNTPLFQYPSRTIVITGERVARMVQAAVRVSRIEQRFVQLSMARPAQSDAARRAMERFNQASNQLESELTQIEKEMESASRAGQERRGSSSAGGKVQRTEKRPTLTRDQGKPNGNGQQQKPTSNAQQKPQQDSTKASAKNPSSQGKQTAGNEQSQGGQQLTKRQQREARAAGASVEKPATDAAAAPVPTEVPQAPSQQAPDNHASTQPAATPTAAPAALASL